MRNEFLPFSKPSLNDEDVNAVAEAIRSGWITTGARASEFEKQIQKYTGCYGSVALSSATAGMHLVLMAKGIGPGDEVITPAMTWVSTVNQIVLAGATPVFVDVDRDTLMASERGIESKITERTRLIAPVHFAGAALEVDAIYRVAGKHGIPVVEDAAHALGTKAGGRRVGEKGTAIFSFHPIKNLTTGEGGMVCSEDSELLERIQRLKFHGLGVDAYDRQTQGRAPQAEVLEPGYKYNLTDMAAALGLSQLSRLDSFNARRAELAAWYRDRLSNVPEILPLNSPEIQGEHSWNLFVIRLDIDSVALQRDRFMEELKRRNIGTGLHFRAVHLQKYYMERGHGRRGMLPDTEWNSDRICSLPLFPDMTEDDARDVIDAIKDILWQCRN